jgi:hypothetical protein
MHPQPLESIYCPQYIRVFSNNDIDAGKKRGTPHYCG